MGGEEGTGGERRGKGRKEKERKGRGEGKGLEEKEDVSKGRYDGRAGQYAQAGREKRPEGEREK